jgi:hypothetical protein
MQINEAIRYSEIILAFAYVQQSAEFIRGLKPEKYLGYFRLALSLLLIFNVQPMLVELGLLIIAAILLQRFQGPYCGGSDCMSILVLLCLFLAHIAPTKFWQEIALGYLAFQLTFSYFQSGYIKVINGDWRSGQALKDVFAITAYPVSNHVRQWANSNRLMFLMSWAVILFELLFPLSLLNHYALVIALVIAAIFHLANAGLFGLNRFFWIWPAAYPVILWFQNRVLDSFHF